MSITPGEVREAFTVQIDTVNVTYTKYITNTLPKLPLIISNSSDTFGIQFYPTSSVGIRFITENNIFIGKNSPVTLSPNTGSNVSSSIKLFAIIDTSGFNTSSVSSSTYPINFDLVAVTSSIFSNIPQTTSLLASRISSSVAALTTRASASAAGTESSGISFTGGGGSEIPGSTFNINTGTIDSTIPDRNTTQL